MTLVLLHELAQVAVRSATEFVASKSVAVEAKVGGERVILIHVIDTVTYNYTSIVAYIHREERNNHTTA